MLTPQQWLFENHPPSKKWNNERIINTAILLEKYAEEVHSNIKRDLVDINKAHEEEGGAINNLMEFYQQEIIPLDPVKYSSGTLDNNLIRFFRHMRTMLMKALLEK